MSEMLKKIQKAKSFKKKREIVDQYREELKANPDMEVFESLLGAAKVETEKAISIGIIGRFDFDGKKEFLLEHSKGFSFASELGLVFFVVFICGFKQEAETLLKESLERDIFHPPAQKLRLLRYGTMFPQTDEWCRPAMEKIFNEEPDLPDYLQNLRETPKLTSMGIFMAEWEPQVRGALGEWAERLIDSESQKDAMAVLARERESY
jgi:hypothetical protein